MNTYTFTVTLEGEGTDAEDAWRDAIYAFDQDPGEPDTIEEIEGNV